MTAGDCILCDLLIPADVCNPNPCKNGGICRLGDRGYNWGYACICHPEFKGAHCQWGKNYMHLS